jgi:hypothetical protein
MSLHYYLTRLWSYCPLLFGIWQFFLSPHFLILFFGQKAFYPIHDHGMIASAAAATSGAYAVPRQIMIAYLAGAYAVQRHSPGHFLLF